MRHTPQGAAEIHTEVCLFADTRLRDLLPAGHSAGSHASGKEVKMHLAFAMSQQELAHGAKHVAVTDQRPKAVGSASRSKSQQAQLLCCKQVIAACMKVHLCYSALHTGEALAMLLPPPLLCTGGVYMSRPRLDFK
jgi:hypothetical protein